MVASSLIDPKVSRIKFDNQVKILMELSSTWRGKGWIIESTEFPIVRVTFLATKIKPAVAVVTVEIDYTNYNYLAPSLKFLDPITFKPTFIRGIQNVAGKVMDIVIRKHPETGLPFFCTAGIQEYHSHPQHDGDVWDIYRYSDKDNLVYILYTVWLYCINTIKYFHIQLPHIQTPIVQLNLVAE